MKQMSCKDMGGMCDTKISANSMEEMMQKGREHMMTHPELMKKMNEQMKSPNREAESKKWMDDFMAKWNAAPDMK